MSLRQDRSLPRTPLDVERRYKLQQIKETSEKVEKLESETEVDSYLSASSTKAVENRVITEALANKVNVVDGKQLSTNDFTNAYKRQLDNMGDVSGFVEDPNYVHTDNNFTDEHLNNSHTHNNKSILDGISSTSIEQWSNLALYENGGTTDANTTTAPLTLTKVNTPTTDFWYVQTLFYSKVADTSNRKQIAYSYKFDAPIYTRYYISGTWSEWTTGELKSSSISDYEGHLWFKNGMLLQWGSVTISATAANTVTSTTVTFPQSYDFAPFITATPQIAYPNAVTTSVGGGSTTAEAKTGMTIYMTRTNTSETTFRWFAVGFRQA